MGEDTVQAAEWMITDDTVADRMTGDGSVERDPRNKKIKKITKNLKIKKRDFYRDNS
jgi:predicted Ser/Thr protein kinase